MPNTLVFDKNAPALKSSNIFGLQYSEDDSKLILLPVPWEVTVSYRTGTAHGPEKILEASKQVDLYDADVENGYENGFHMLQPDEHICAENNKLRHCAETILEAIGEGVDITADARLSATLSEVNEGCERLRDRVYQLTGNLLKQGKKVGLIGGDHSTPLGFIKALSDIHDDFGVLQIDAHADLRDAYEGFTYSHASIMYNVMEQIPQVKKLVQVGIRDYCDEELAMIRENAGRITTFFDKDIKAQQYEGATWKQICGQIIDALPQKVYISFDIDGLDPKLCPNTGTPVPGGFETEQVFYLFKMLHNSGREIIGFDLNEVSVGFDSKEVSKNGQPCDSIDAIVGARVLYKLCNFMVA